jgi:hypothetical protein
MSRGSSSIESSASFLLLSLSNGPVSDVVLGVAIRPVPSLGVSSTNPSFLIVDAFEGHEVHDSGLLSSLTDGGKMSTPSLTGGFSIEPGLLALVVTVVLEFLLRHAGVDGPEDVVVLVDNEGSSSFADAKEEDPSLSTSTTTSTGPLTLVLSRSPSSTTSTTRVPRPGSKPKRLARDGVVTSPPSVKEERRLES